MWTSTTKVHAPSWSLPAGASCPSIRWPVMQAIREMEKKPGFKLAQRLRPGKDFIDYLKIIKQVEKKFPQKCLACYATGGNYMYPSTKTVQAKRMAWFENTPEDTVVEALVDSIDKAGKEKCSKATGKCEFIPLTRPEYVRLFDSGDFTNERAVRIWEKVARRMPDVKFWWPTTTWMEPCDSRFKGEHARMMTALKKAGKLPNVTIRPSALALDQRAPRIPGFGPGTAVVEGDTVKAQGGVENKAFDLCEGGICEKHFVCPGNCGTCRMCWMKTKPVVYIRHGKKPGLEYAKTLVQRSTGKGGKRYESKGLIQDLFVTQADIGPGD